jgi:hypothetical protein
MAPAMTASAAQRPRYSRMASSQKANRLESVANGRRFGHSGGLREFAAQISCLPPAGLFYETR